MLLEHIRFKKRKALKIEIKSKNDIGQAFTKLGLEKNRPVIVIVGGAGGVREENWGDESSWIAEVGTQLSGDQSSLAVLINGRMIARDMDIPYYLSEGRPIFVIEGTGRAADEFAAHPILI